MLSEWSDTPPTEPGWYWTMHKGLGNEEVAYFCRNGNVVLGGVEDYFADVHVRVGSRIPSNAELLAMHKHIATLTAERDAEVAELEAATQRLIDSEVA